MTVTVGVRDLRNKLRAFLDLVKGGEAILVTERGKPVAVIRPPAGESALERLIAEGRATPPSRPKTPIRLEELPRVRGNAVSELLIEARRAGR